LPEDPNTVNQQRPEAVKAAAELGVELAFVTVRNGDYADAFAKVAANRPDSLFLAATTYFVRDRKPIIALAAKHRLPAIYEWPEQVEDGGLMSYGPTSLNAIYRRIAEKIDRILELEPDLVLGFSDLQADIGAELVRRGIEVHERGLWRSRRVATVNADSVLDVGCDVTDAAKQDETSRGLIIRTPRGVTSFAADLDDQDLRYLCALVRRALAGEFRRGFGARIPGA